MHVHILGICGTLMGSIALLARAQGHIVTGSDDQVYPPMSTQLAEEGIELQSPYCRDSIPPDVDLVVLGNAGLGRGNPAVEALLASRIDFCSGAEFLGRHILKDKWVVAIAGTHGKTTTASLIAWILECAGLNPSYLIGGIPNNFKRSARLTDSPFFVIEADEYDTSYFDRQSKFLHYHPQTLVINNLEFDHADIFEDLKAIENQFHQLIRQIPEDGLIVHNLDDRNVEALVQRGCWSQTLSFAINQPPPGEIDTGFISDPKGSRITLNGSPVGTLDWRLTGAHNVSNALAAIAAARHVGVLPADSLTHLNGFLGVKRRMEQVGLTPGATLYDDFAHHPTAIKTTLEGLRTKVGDEPIYALLEPRSHTMRLGHHHEQLGQACATADRVFWLKPENLAFDLDLAVSAQGHFTFESEEDFIKSIAQHLAGESRHVHLVMMSNGAFDTLKTALLQMMRDA